MTSIASPTFLLHLKSLYPASGSVNPWYIIATVGFAACSRPEAIPAVFRHAMKEIEGANHDDKHLLVRRMRDALFMAGVINGYPKAINALKSLFDATPEEFRDSEPLRNTKLSLSELEEKGRTRFRQTYGDTADAVQLLLDTIYPDLGWFSNNIAYGIVYSFDGVLTRKEMSYVLCAALIASDLPLETRWHINGARRNGATIDEIKAVRTIAIEVAKEGGVVWRNQIPEVE